MTEIMSLKPPESVACAAEKGLAFREKFNRGSTPVGISRAQELKEREDLDPDTILRMASYFSRHEVDKRGKNFGNDQCPSNGYIAWLLWGGDEGQKWANTMKTILKGK